MPKFRTVDRPVHRMGRGPRFQIRVGRTVLETVYPSYLDAQAAAVDYVYDHKDAKPEIIEVHAQDL